MLRYSIAIVLTLCIGQAWAECDPDFEDCDAQVQKSPEQIAKEKAQEELLKKPFDFTEVRKVNLKKDEIIKFSASYIAENFKSAKKVIELNDLSQGKIIGNVILRNSEAGFFDAFHGIEATIIIEAKENRFRFKAINVYGLTKDMVRSVWSSEVDGSNAYRIKPMAYKVLNKFLTNIENYLNKAKSESKW